MATTEILVSGGVAAVLAALVGGGLKAFGIELPILASVPRQALLAVAGLGMLAAGLLVDRLPASGGREAAGAAAPAGETAATPLPSGTATAPSPVPAAVPAAQPEVPNIVGLPFATARQFLIQNGWSPINSASGPLANADRLGLRGEEMWKAGYREAVSCSGTGMAPCTFRYRDRAGHALEVIAVGEGEQEVNDVVLVECAKAPEGC